MTTIVSERLFCQKKTHCLIHVWYKIICMTNMYHLTNMYAKEPYKRDDILQKRPIFLRSLLIVATPYEIFWMTNMYHHNESGHWCNAYGSVISLYGWVMSHIWMRCVTHMNASCHVYGWVMSHTCMRCVTHMDESCHCMDESCHTYACVV